MTDLRPQQATGYTLVLPPGWLRLDARTQAGTQELDRELDRALNTVAKDSYSPLISQARKQAHTVLDQARAAGALDLYLPLGGMHSAPTPASFLVTIVHLHDTPPGGAEAQDPEAASMTIATMLAARMPQGEVKQMRAGITVRSRQEIPATGASPWPGTRVDYHWPLPSQPRKWALATFTTLGAGKPDDDITELLIGLFDAIMLTWRWQPALLIQPTATDRSNTRVAHRQTCPRYGVPGCLADTVDQDRSVPHPARGPIKAGRHPPRARPSPTQQTQRLGRIHPHQPRASSCALCIPDAGIRASIQGNS